MAKTNTTPLRKTLYTVSVQIYSLLIWLLVLLGGMVAVGGFFVDNLTLGNQIAGFSVGLVTIIFALGMARLLNRDIKQTAPVLWF